MLYTMCVCIRCRRSRVYSNAFKCIIFTAQLQTNGIIFRFVYNNLQNMLASISVKRTSNNSTTKYNDTHLKKEFDRETDNTTDKLTNAYRADTLYSSPKYTSRNQCTYSLWRVVCINFPRRKTLWLMWKMHLKCIKCCIQMLTKCNFSFSLLLLRLPLSIIYLVSYTFFRFCWWWLWHKHTSNMAEIFLLRHFFWKRETQNDVLMVRKCVVEKKDKRKSERIKWESERMWDDVNTNIYCKSCTMQSVEIYVKRKHLVLQNFPCLFKF